MMQVAPDALLSENDRKEALSRAYAVAVAGFAGYCTSSPDFDRDSVDLSFSAGPPRCPRIDVQLKASAVLKKVNGMFTFDLPIKNYNDLRAETLVPRALIVLDLPDQEGDWLTLSSEELVMKRSAYYKILTGAEETENTKTISIKIDPNDRFDVPALQALMAKARAGSLT